MPESFQHLTPFADALGLKAVVVPSFIPTCGGSDARFTRTDDIEAKTKTANEAYYQVNTCNSPTKLRNSH